MSLEVPLEEVQEGIRLRKTLDSQLQTIPIYRRESDKVETYRNYLRLGAGGRSRGSGSRGDRGGGADDGSPAGGARIPQDKLYRKVSADMRIAVESYLQMEGAHTLGTKKRGRDRDDLEDTPMWEAFKLREAKKHEQEALVAATLQRGGIAVVAADEKFGITERDVAMRRRRMEIMARSLVDRENKTLAEHNELKKAEDLWNRVKRMDGSGWNNDFGRDDKKRSESSSIKSKHRLERERKDKEEEGKLEQMFLLSEKRDQEKARDRAKKREEQRELAYKMEEEERRANIEREKEEALRKETPRQSLRRLYEPIFRTLWDLEFDNLNGANPFRIVIDKDTCAAIGAPDYCEVVKKPMNLTYIERKVTDEDYETLQEFFADVELLISNALLYNSSPSNEYHIAALEFKRRFKKLRKSLLTSLQQ